MIEIFMDGNMWCALTPIGANLQEGCAGFGVSQADSLIDLANKLVSENWEIESSR